MGGPGDTSGNFLRDSAGSCRRSGRGGDKIHTGSGRTDRGTGARIFSRNSKAGQREGGHIKSRTMQPPRRTEQHNTTSPDDVIISQGAGGKENNLCLM